MLDSELAELYGIDPWILNEQVKRNLERFPDNFRFQLTEDELKNLRSKNATSSSEEFLRSQIVTSSLNHGGKRCLSYVFTEQGVSMLSAVLKSPTAIEMSIKLINSFVEMRRFLSSNGGLFQRLDLIERR